MKKYYAEKEEEWNFERASKTKEINELANLLQQERDQLEEFRNNETLALEVEEEQRKEFLAEIEKWKARAEEAESRTSVASPNAGDEESRIQERKELEAEFNYRIATLQSQLQESQAAVESMQKNSESKDTELAQKDQEIEELRQESLQLQESLSALMQTEGGNEDLRAALEDALAKKDDIEMKARRLGEVFLQTKEELTKKIQHQQQQLEEFAGRMKGSTADTTSLKNQVNIYNFPNLINNANFTLDRRVERKRPKFAKAAPSC